MRSGCCPKDQVIVSNILGLFKMEAALTQDIALPLERFTEYVFKNDSELKRG